MRVLVTGATGFVGQNLVPVLLDRGHSVTALSRDEAKFARMPWSSRAAFLRFDIHSGATSLPQAVGSHDALVHLAWPGLPNYKDLFHFEVNLPADYRFLKASVAAGIQHVLVTGTCFEYGMQSGQLPEEAPTLADNPYGLAKDILRRFLEHLQKTTPFTLQWARLFYIFGAGQNPKSVIGQLERAISAGEPTFDMSGGEQLRDFLPVEDVAERLAFLVEHPEVAGVINVCSGKPISVRRLVEERIAARGAAIVPNLGRFAYPDYEPMAFWGDASRLDRVMSK